MLGPVEDCALSTSSVVVGGGDEGEGSGGTGVFLSFLRQFPIVLRREDKKEGNVVAVDEERRKRRKKPGNQGVFSIVGFCTCLRKTGVSFVLFFLPFGRERQRTEKRGEERFAGWVY